MVVYINNESYKVKSMNIVCAYGSNRKVTLVEDIVYYCIHQLMPRMKTLMISVEFEKEKQGYGYCLAVDKREFELTINKSLKGDELIKTVCHEMVHVKQYARGELKVNDELDYKTYEEYENQWYEKEAFEMEKELAEGYKEYIKVNNF